MIIPLCRVKLIWQFKVYPCMLNLIPSSFLAFSGKANMVAFFFFLLFFMEDGLKKEPF